ncbi:MFS transporter, partial [Saccharothrix sp. MB29]|nr:MFS transporter [Saccharothrix sp. MB29]
MTGPAEALAEPAVPVRRSWMTLLFLANLGLWLAIYAPIQELLPQQAELLDATAKEAVFGLVMGVGALA